MREAVCRRPSRRRSARVPSAVAAAGKTGAYNAATAVAMRSIASTSSGRGIAKLKRT